MTEGELKHPNGYTLEAIKYPQASILAMNSLRHIYGLLMANLLICQENSNWWPSTFLKNMMSLRIWIPISRLGPSMVLYHMLIANALFELPEYQQGRASRIDFI